MPKSLKTIFAAMSLAGAALLAAPVSAVTLGQPEFTYQWIKGNPSIGANSVTMRVRMTGNVDAAGTDYVVGGFNFELLYPTGSISGLTVEACDDANDNIVGTPGPTTDSDPLSAYRVLVDAYSDGTTDAPSVMKWSTLDTFAGGTSGANTITRITGLYDGTQVPFGPASTNVDPRDNTVTTSGPFIVTESSNKGSMAAFLDIRFTATSGTLTPADVVLRQNTNPSVTEWIAFAEADNPTPPDFDVVTLTPSNFHLNSTLLEVIPAAVPEWTILD